ncbi:motility protein A [Candidatus Sumerlaeota bacterium]|nr:motility protein A [Candidatus Sumerlaeota bacterium]
MDIATIIGTLAAFGLVFMAIGPSNMQAFLDVPSILIVIGGTIGATLIAFPLGEVMKVFSVVKNTVLFKKFSQTEMIHQLVAFSSQARRDGILALENASKEVDDLFVQRGIQLAVDGQEPDAIENILTLEIEAIESRHKRGAEILSTMGMLSPAMGMVGTLIGLVQMLQNMSDPSAIGPAMAVALLTTFYGAILANVLFNPLAAKLRLRSREELDVRQLTREGIMAIAAGDNPRIVEQKLHAYLQPAKRESQFQ